MVKEALTNVLVTLHAIVREVIGVLSTVLAIIRVLVKQLVRTAHLIMVN